MKKLLLSNTSGLARLNSIPSVQFCCCCLQGVDIYYYLCNGSEMGVKLDFLPHFQTPTIAYKWVE